jgi:hypothetical protein
MSTQTSHNNADVLEKATDFIWRSARLLDRLRFQYLFQNGSLEPVLTALKTFQNEDGGFGNSLEPDLRAPISLPVPTWSALVVMDQIDHLDEAMAQQACDYLMTITTEEGGVPFILPAGQQYPHAFWWGSDDYSAGLNPTGGLVGLLNKLGVQHPWLERATEFVWKKIDALEATSEYEINNVFSFLESVPDRDRAQQAMKRVGPKLFEQNLVALDPKAEGTVHFLLDYAPYPNSIARQLFDDDVIEQHLDAVIEAQDEDGGWSFNFDGWNDMTTLEWRGWMTVGNLLTLRKNGRL